MRRRHRDGSKTVMLAALAVSITVGLVACGSSGASSNPTSPATVPAATTTIAAQPAATTTAPPTTDATVTVSDAEVADMEKQLDEIDQVLAGVDADLSQD